MFGGSFVAHLALVWQLLLDICLIQSYNADLHVTLQSLSLLQVCANVHIQVWVGILEDATSICMAVSYQLLTLGVRSRVAGEYMRQVRQGQGQGQGQRQISHQLTAGNSVVSPGTRRVSKTTIL